MCAPTYTTSVVSLADSPTTPLSLMISLTTSHIDGSSSYVCSSSLSLSSAVGSPFSFSLPLPFALLLLECVCLRTVMFDKGVVSAREHTPASAPVARSSCGVSAVGGGDLPFDDDDDGPASAALR